MTHFLTIQQTAQRTGLSTHTLRYYERIGLLDPVGRRDNRHRLFSEQDLLWIQFLLKLKSTGLPIRDMVLYADLRRRGDTPESVSARKALLEQHTLYVQRTIASLQENLQVLQNKLQMYQELLHSAADPAIGHHLSNQEPQHDTDQPAISPASPATPPRT